jgi:hypothetical protein
MNGYFTNQKGKRIGTVSGDTYSKKVKKSKHLLRILNAWGIDKEVVDHLARSGVTKVLIHESEEKIDYFVPLSEFIEKGILRDFGHSPQVFLPITSFIQNDGSSLITDSISRGANEEKNQITASPCH